MSTSFVVEDSQKVFEASVKAEKIDKNYSSLDAVFEDPDYVKFSYAGHELGKVAGTDNYAYASSKNTKVNDKSTRVEKVTMNVELPGTSTSGIDNKVVQMTAPVNRTFTFTSVPTTDSNVKASINTVKAFADSNNDLKSGLTKANLSTIVSKAVQAKNEYEELTTAEQDVLEDDRDDAVEIGEKAALVIVKDVTTYGEVLSLDVFDILGVKNAKVANFAAYKTLMADSSITGLSSVSSATSALQSMVDSVADAPVAVSLTYDAVVSAIKTVSGTTLSASYSVVSTSSVTATASGIHVSGTGITTTSAISDNSTDDTSIGFTHTGSAVVGDIITIEYAIAVTKDATCGSAKVPYSKTGTVTVKYECTTAGTAGTSAWKVINN